ncbi:phosphoribosyltransferase family protein [Enterococcus sp.]|uniref:phosphoribosyltransferase family protein n=1 Tax=Enterococcus sp. TaxID=35783 RepID=UPI002FCA02ED
MEKTYGLQVAGLKRTLPIIQVAEDLAIASFVLLGDAEMTTQAAIALAKKLPTDIDYLVTAEAKGIPLLQELARIMDFKTYIVARKSVKAYMDAPLEASVFSITTQKEQTLILDGRDAALIAGKNVAIIDDVISTGESLQALVTLVEKAGANVIAQAAVLAEGDAAKREDIVFLEELPLFPR